MLGHLFNSTSPAGHASSTTRRTTVSGTGGKPRRGQASCSQPRNFRATVTRSMMNPATAITAPMTATDSVNSAPIPAPILAPVSGGVKMDRTLQKWPFGAPRSLRRG